MHKPAVTAAILLFHPDIPKTILTMRSVLSQEDIDLEILVCDDGSGETYDDVWKELFEEYGFCDYQIINAPVNQGTVKNCLSAAEHASGKYLFLTSPGDLLYDSHTLKALYDTAEARQCQICFGSALFYRSNAEDGSFQVFEELDHSPVYLQVYERNDPKLKKLDFFIEDPIIGASYFRTVEMARQSFRAVSETAVYMEDTTSTMYALVHGGEVFYAGTYAVWYEYGGGISTGRQDRWAKLLDEDLMKTAAALRNRKDACLDYFFSRRQSGKKGMLGRLLKHPVLFFRQIRIKKTPKYSSTFMDYDTTLIQNLLQKVYKKEFKQCR